MTTTRFSDPTAFRDLVLPLLTPFEAENNLPLGVLSGVVSDPNRFHNVLLAVVHTGPEPSVDNIASVFMRTPPFPVMVAYGESAADPAVVETVIALLQDVYGSDIGGFNLDTRLADAYVNAWVAATGANKRLRMSMRTYRCTRVNSLPTAPGTPRPPTAADAATLRAFVTGFYHDALPEEYDPQRVESYVKRVLTADPAQQGMLLWERDGEVVSMAAYSGPTPHGIRVNAVYTPKEHRKQGYARSCVAELTMRLLAEGRSFCFLFTDLTNPTSNRIYQEIGYEPVSDYVNWDISQVSVPRATEAES